MINEKQIINIREQNRQIKKIVNEFLKKKEFTDFEIESLNVLRAEFNAAYYSYKDNFYNYLENNIYVLNSIINKLDEESKNVIKSTIKDAKYLSTHNIVDLIRELFNKEKEIMEHVELINTYKNLKLYANLYESSVFCYKHGLIYLPEEKIKKLNNKDFVDAGAYIGDSALVFEKYFNPKKIYSFEPDEENYNYILNTIKLNDLKKVVPIKMGVGSKEFSANFKHNSTISRISDTNTETKVEITSIDKFVFDRNLDIGLIKFDIEGYELEALIGAKRTIEEFKPVLLISIYHTNQQFFSIIKYVQEIELKYNIIIRHLDDFIPIAETYLIAW